MALRAVIFDMDGTLIDSEPFWSKAEAQVFGSLGVTLTKADTALTSRMTTAEVARFWYDKSPWSEPGLPEVEQRVIQAVAHMIKAEGKAMPGAVELVKTFHTMGVKLGLATNSPESLISIVLEKLGLDGFFEVCCSSEHELAGKPDPAVYLSAMHLLGVQPADCLAFEDSVSGVRSAQAAGIRTVVIPEPAHFDLPKWDLADLKVPSLAHFLSQMPQILKD